MRRLTSVSASGERSHRVSVFVTLLMSYLVVLLIPVIVFGGLYSRIEKVMIENANNANMALIEQAKQVVDGRLDEMHLISRNITSHPKLDVLLKASTPQNGAENYSYYSFIQEMQRYRNSSSFITDFYVYLRESDIVLSPTLKTTSSILFSDIYGYTNLNYNQYQSDILHGIHLNRYMPVTEVGKGLNQKRMLTYMQTLPFGEKRNPKGALIMLIEEKQIAGLLQEIVKSNHGTIYIKDASGQVILSAGESAESSTWRTERDHPMLTVSTISARSGWEYISVVPEHVFMEKVNMVKRMAAGVLAICLAAGIAACAYMTYRAYHPLRDIIRFIIQAHPARDGEVRNEYEFIKSTMVDSFGKQTMMKEQLSRQTPVIRSNFLQRLLKGSVDESDMSDHAMAFMGLTFPYPGFAVALIELRDASGFIHNERESEWALIRFVTGKVAEEIHPYTAYAVEMEKNLVALIVNVPEPLENIEVGMHDWAEQVKQVIEQRFRTVTTIGISGIHIGPGGLSSGYSESQKALEYSIFTACQPILFYREMQQQTEAYYDFPIETEVKLINAVKSGEFDKVQDLIQCLYHNNFVRKSISPELGRLMFSNLLSTMFKLLNALNLKFEDIFGTAGSSIEHITVGGTVEELYEEVKWRFGQVCHYVRNQRGDSSSLLLEKIQRYITDHHDDTMISLASIAEQFNITPPYLSAFFKKNSGTNLTDYLAKIRIEHAKEMMRDARNTISHIARSVGYTSDVGFIRVFKKYEASRRANIRKLCILYHRP
ncbi:AraC family transcriptional regulator [Paenibacillus sp. JCM 10914]|uniref:AraC family transcriptional regulator n=1 Tax=Paenibacillus sp. JCM 10914 TaxID=1236974 RepID=UPI0003CC3447|nr:AraC family transcriptional regulator [Paenibacillus sp. JCM 10914]GAE05429.1 hypothetical protein JCM10914_1528 [Paenibacillus sp. JCM 10914]